MKTLIIVLLLIFTSSVQAQLRSIESKKLSINFDKTVHLVFPMNIDYFDIGSDNILAEQPDKAPFVLKVKANTENFPEETSISVITVDGKFYSFSIDYKDQVEEATIFVDQETHVIPANIPVSMHKSIHLLMPTDIIYSDVGNEQSISIDRTGSSNVLRFIAKYNEIPQTNLSIITSDRNFYSFLLDYNNNPQTYNYAVGEQQNTIAFVNNNEKILEEISQKALKHSRSLYHLGVEKNKMEFCCTNIFIKNDILFFCFSIKNTSNINFNMDFVKCFIRDIKQVKNTTIQETEMQPVISSNLREVVPSQNEYNFVLAFNKFTIPDKKKFEIEIFDKDGGRHLRFRIKNKSIIAAEKLP